MLVGVNIIINIISIIRDSVMVNDMKNIMVIIPKDNYVIPMDNYVIPIKVD